MQIEYPRITNTNWGQPPSTLKPTPKPELESECTDTPDYLDMWGGGCADYELPKNVAWCNAYGSTGESGKTPNENCCVCKVLVAGKDDQIALPWEPSDDSPSSFQVSLNDEMLRLNTEVVEIGYEYLFTNTLITLFHYQKPSMQPSIIPTESPLTPKPTSPPSASSLTPKTTNSPSKLEKTVNPTPNSTIKLAPNIPIRSTLSPSLTSSDDSPMDQSSTDTLLPTYQRSQATYMPMTTQDNSNARIEEFSSNNSSQGHRTNNSCDGWFFCCIWLLLSTSIYFM